MTGGDGSFSAAVNFPEYFSCYGSSISAVYVRLKCYIKCSYV